MPDLTPYNQFLDVLRNYPMQLVGSTAINGTGLDIDIAVQVNAITPEDMVQARAYIDQLQFLGCSTQGGAHYEAINLEADEAFVSMRTGQLNLLLCFNERSWNRFIKGRDFCVLLNELGVDMSSKAVRVAVHSMVSTGDVTLVERDLERLRVR